MSYLILSRNGCLLTIETQHSQKNYCVTPEESLHYTNEVFGLIKDGTVKINIHKEYPFTAEGVIDAQKDLTGGKTTGKLVIKITDE